MNNKDIFEEERKLYEIEIINSHHKGTGRAIIMTRKLKLDLGTKKRIDRLSMVTEPNFGGKLRTK